MKVIRHILNAILYVGIFFIMALAVVPLFGYELVTIESASMYPALHVGSLCIVDTKAELQYLTRGDIITFQAGTDSNEQPIYVTHRVKSINGDNSIVTKGDANSVKDSNPVQMENVLGVVKFNVPILGYIIKALGQWYVKLVCIAALILLLILVHILDEKIGAVASGNTESE